MNAAAAPAVNYDEFFAYLEDELDQASYQFADTYLQEFLNWKALTFRMYVTSCLKLWVVGYKSLFIADVLALISAYPFIVLLILFLTMGCEISIYKTTVVSNDVSTSTELMERTELLDYKSYELGEILAGALELPNGRTCSADPVHLAALLTDYRDDSENDDDEKSC